MNTNRRGIKINETKIKKGETYIICDNNVSIGTYTYVGTKSGVNSQNNLSMFLMFKKYDHISNYERIEGYEFSENGLVEKSITIQCTKRVRL